MGHGIAQVSAMAGYNVVLRDIEQQFLDKDFRNLIFKSQAVVS
jgi:enoyl-CoA hydratase / 3-hydroxyacyl-CoA dehydrogenase